MRKRKFFSSKFGQAIIGIISPLLKPVITGALAIAWKKVHEKDEDAYKTTLTTIYVPIDVHLEELAKRSGTDFDDMVIEAIMDSIEESARLHNLELPNLDND